MNIHLKTSLDYIKRAPFQALAGILVLSVTFFVATLLAVLTYSSSRVLAYFETKPQIIAYLKKEATEEMVAALEEKLTRDPRVKNLKFVSKGEALEFYKRVTADNPLLAELVSPTIFPASLEFSLSDLSTAKTLVEEISKEGVVESVSFTASLGGKDVLGEVLDRLKNIVFYLRLGGGLFVALLGASSFLVLLVLMSLRMNTRRKEMETLSLIGARARFIQAPIILEALEYALIGIVLGWLAAVILILYTAPPLMAYFRQAQILPTEPVAFFGLLLIILLAESVFGLLIAWLGTFLAVSRSLKNK